MKIILLFLISFNLFAQQFYVDKDASGSNNGTSWTNAWESFADIVWDSLSAGDTLFISGGTDSTIYHEELIPQCKGTESNRVIIIAGKYASSASGHSGRVIIDGDSIRSYSIYMNEYASTGPSYITIKGFELREGTAGVNHNTDVGGKGLVYDSLTVYDFYGHAGFKILGGDSTTIRNCTITTPLLVAGETDCIYADLTSRMYVFNNVIRNRNQDPLAHNDAIQGVDADGWVIWNNVIINDSVYSSEGGGLPLILGSTNGGNDYPVIIYNNFLYMGGVWYPNGNQGYTLWTRFYGTESEQSPTWVIHNTVVTNGPRVRGVGYQYNIDVFVNNIDAMYCLDDGVQGEDWRTGGTHGWMTTYDVGDQNTWSDPPIDSIRYNLLWKEDSVAVGFAGTYTQTGVGQVSISGWSDWVNKGGTGLNRDPLFVHTFGYEPDQGALDGELQSGSPAINAGEDAEWYINYLNATYNLSLEWKDINGNARDSTPDIGAYQYVPVGKTKLFLKK